ncbi:LPXTG cell wall anchor domain-containing protein [Micromonospora vinacea]|uniref:LPXTG cell wall anchor domain-containing protein n=1 Tax=Micromonospora TaxID=1873 RepID=UPI003862F8F5|nr:LPXTG cell wall anchor domain-containing protein [Micromonospora sp. NBC_00860]WTA67458.1 LPXTG cell wall anchor domain-containing protein [Micromonospora sp. NBC_00855]
MARTAANYLAGGALAAIASLALAVSPMLAAADPASARGFGAVRPEPSAGGGVTFEILPATPTPTQPPPTSTPTAPPQPTPSHGGELPVTGSGGSVLLIAMMGAALIVAGWFAARRHRPS